MGNQLLIALVELLEQLPAMQKHVKKMTNNKFKLLGKFIDTLIEFINVNFLKNKENDK